ncbi:MAG: hypothetical protein COA84_10370 [Robiginitomaculum sp.]|nr:MAG: hypothetical protein COA84_10370 [Robiginitomaculum sp.]
MFETQIERARRLITKPAAEWEVIDGEAVDVSTLFKTWVLPLATIPALSGFLAHSFMGAHSRLPITQGVFNALFSYVISLAGVYALAYILTAIAPYFGAQKNFNQALKLAAYSPVAAWTSSIFMAMPALSFLAVLGGLYSLYLLYVGVRVLMTPSQSKAVYFAAIAIVLAMLINGVGGQYGHKKSADQRVQTQSEVQTQNRNNGVQEGDLAGMIAALNGGSYGVVSDLEALKALVPQKMSGLRRTYLDVKTLQTPLKTITVQAKYQGENDQEITLTLMNSTGVNFIKTLAGLSGINRSKTEDDGSFETLKRDGDKVVLQTWDALAAQGNFAWSYKNFIVSLGGHNISLKALEKAANTITSTDLDRLPTD